MGIERRGAWVFGAAAALFLAALWRLRYVGLNLDEASCITMARWVGQGRGLYAYGGWQHMPLDVLGALPLARAGFVRDPAPYRLLGLLAQVLAALSLALSGAFEGRRGRGWAAACLYLLFFAGRDLGLQAHVYSGYGLAGAAWVVSLACLALPLALERTPAPAAAALGGAAFATWALSSPALAFAALFFLAACLGSPRLRGAPLGAAAAGGLVVAGATFAWIIRHGPLDAWWEKAILFNLEVYPRLNREPGASGLLPGALRGFVEGLGGWGAAWSAIPLAWLALWAAAGRRTRWLSAALALGFAALHVRMHFWKGLPFHCAAMALTAAALLLPPPRARWPWLAPVLLGALAAALAGGLRALASPPADYWHAGPAAQTEAVFDALRPRLPAGSSLLSLHNSPQLYLLTGLPTGVGKAGYGPLGVLMDWTPGRPPLETNLCAMLPEARPALIFERRDYSMYYINVAAMIPPCLDDFKAEHYRAVEGWPHWWVRKDLGGVTRGLPNPPGLD